MMRERLSRRGAWFLFRDCFEIEDLDCDDHTSWQQSEVFRRLGRDFRRQPESTRSEEGQAEEGQGSEVGIEASAGCSQDRPQRFRQEGQQGRQTSRH